VRRFAAAAGVATLVLAGCGAHARHAAPPVTTQKHVVHNRRHHHHVRRVSPHRAAIPVLVFHAVGTPPPGAPWPTLYDPRGIFAQQIRWLARNGYHAVTMQRAYDFWRRGDVLPPRPVVLTFDDGYPGVVTFALPLLRRLGWPAVLNLQVGNLMPAHVRKLIRAGWEIDAHTFTHPDLTQVDPARLRREVAGSRAWIHRMFGVPVRFFAYPNGRFDPAVVAAVRAAGFAGAETTVTGDAAPGQGLFTLHRIRVTPSLGLFVAALHT